MPLNDQIGPTCRPDGARLSAAAPISNLAMTDIDLDGLDPLELSLCEPCAKHESLKRFSLKHSPAGKLAF